MPEAKQRGEKEREIYLARQKRRSFPGKESLSSIPPYMYLPRRLLFERRSLFYINLIPFLFYFYPGIYIYIYRKDPFSARNALEMLTLRGGVIKAHDLSMSVKLSTSIRPCKPRASQ